LAERALVLERVLAVEGAKAEADAANRAIEAAAIFIFGLCLFCVVERVRCL
jgi:hypothetical protein